MSSAPILAAVVAKARRKIQHHFFSEDAVRSDRAVPFAPSNAIEARQFERMLERGIIRREGADRYWVDVVAYDQDMQMRHRRVKVVLWAVIIALALALIASGVSEVLRARP